MKTFNWNKENLQKLQQEATERTSFWYSCSTGKVGQKYGVSGKCKEVRLNYAERYKKIAKYLSVRLEN